jgi:hypothetical protein
MDDREIQQMDEFAALFANVLFGVLWAMVGVAFVALACIKMSGPAL